MMPKRNSAMGFIVLMGFVSLFGDITYEGARSVVGPYMAFLGASAAMVGLVAGVGEFLGYSLRLFSGFMADRTGAYWAFTFLGYGMIFAIPFLAFSGSWQVAAVLIILERAGKAVRSPARDAVLSYATKKVGRGWGFAIHEAMDQIGAILGPAIFSVVFFLKGTYKQGFSILFLPAFFVLALLFIARKNVPVPENLEDVNTACEPNGKGAFSKTFWLYSLFSFLCVAGFANFQIMSYHFHVKGLIPDSHIPLLYVVAMAVDAVAALLVGKAYDKIGLKVLILLPLLTMPIPFFGFSGNFSFILVGVILWGLVLGMQETVMRAAIADLTHIKKRGMAYGIFNAIYGLSWFVASLVMGLLYDRSISWLLMFVFVVEAISIPVFFAIEKSSRD